LKDYKEMEQLNIKKEETNKEYSTQEETDIAIREFTLAINNLFAKPIQGNFLDTLTEEEYASDVRKKELETNESLKEELK